MLLIVGVDPGLVHTGIVLLKFDLDSHTFGLESVVIDGQNNLTVALDEIIDTLCIIGAQHVFIEKYEPRSHFGTDAHMMELVREIHKRTKHSRVISNAGSKQVIKPALLGLLHLKKFPTTHHQDLQAAARILVYGMLKNPDLNRVLVNIVQDHLDNKPWRFL